MSWDEKERNDEKPSDEEKKEKKPTTAAKRKAIIVNYLHIIGAFPSSFGCPKIFDGQWLCGGYGIKLAVREPLKHTLLFRRSLDAILFVCC